MRHEQMEKEGKKQEIEKNKLIISKDVYSTKIKKIKKDMAKVICFMLVETSIDTITGYEELCVNKPSVNHLVNNYSLEEFSNIFCILEFMYQQEDNRI
ncbi:hypothetical protein [Alkalihalobacillus deserti]|uniref:hypothetical protein n=1 Tax=Alkalihalobacillus deserti TaxID=2879466 RepID=UPI001D15081F|nr:hypothetical protein [Alkalihalobacillus deserti]